MQSINENPYIKILSGLSEGELLPEITLKTMLENPIDLIVMDKLGNPERSTLADKMLFQLQKLEQQESDMLYDFQYLIILTANLTLYFYYEEDNQEADYWEKMEEGYKRMERISPDLNDQQKAQYKFVMGITYKIIKYYPPAIKTFNEAISLFKKDINKNSRYIRDCFLNIIDSHIAQAHRYDLDKFPSDAIQAEYTQAIQAVNEALLTLKQQKISFERLYYYNGQIAYLLAKGLGNQKINVKESIKFLNTSVSAFLRTLLGIKSEDSQVKLHQRIIQCYELFKELKIESSRENISNIEHVTYNYAQLNRFFNSQATPTNRQLSFDEKLIKKLLDSFESKRPFSLTDSNSMPLGQQKLEAHKKDSDKPVIFSPKGSIG